MVRKDFRGREWSAGLKEVIPFCLHEGYSPASLPSYGYPEPKRIGMELDVLPVNFFERYRQGLSRTPNSCDATPLIRKVRMIKTHYEIHILQDAAQQVDKVYRRAGEVIREGMTDLELAAELEYYRPEGGTSGADPDARLSMARCSMPRFFPVPIPPFRPMWIPRSAGWGLTPSFGQGAS